MPGITLNSESSTNPAVRRPLLMFTSRSASPWSTIVARDNCDSPLGTVARREDREHLAGGSVRVVAAVDGLRTPVAHVGRGPGIRGADQILEPDPRVDPLADSAGTMTVATGEALGVGHSVLGLTGGRHHRGDRPDPLRVLDGDALHDHPAHRCAHDVRPIDLEGVQDGDRVGGHVAQCVGSLDGSSGGRRGECLEHVGHLRVEVGREADVAVVETHHPEPLLHEAFAEVLLVARQLGPEPVHQQDRLGSWVSEGLEVDLDVVRPGGRHPGILGELDRPVKWTRPSGDSLPRPPAPEDPVALVEHDHVRTVPGSQSVAGQPEHP